MGGQLPAQKWLAAVSPLTDRLPVVPLLGGHLKERQSFSSSSYLSAMAASAAAVSIDRVRSQHYGLTTFCLPTSLLV